MQRHPRSVVDVATFLIAAVVLSSCDRHPTAPRPGSAGPNSSPTVRFEMIAPSSIGPGESVQLRARAIKSDDSEEDVTASTRWGGCCNSVLEVTSTGLATGRSLGEATIWASYATFQSSKITFVLPPGTFRLAGRVTDSGVGLENAVVTVVSGIGQGTTAVTDGTGAYRIYGVAGRIRVAVRKAGYPDRIEDLDISDHRGLDVELVADRRSDIRGIYSLRIDSPPCARTWGGPFPDEARHRSYTATVAQEGGAVTVTLSGASLVQINGRGGQFSGLLEPNDVITFSINWTDYYYIAPIGSNDLVDGLSNGDVLVIGGRVTARRTASGISGTLNGTFNLSTGAPPFTWPFISQCQAPATAFEMVRQ